MTAYRFHLFGTPNFETSAGASIAIRSRKGVGLLACLALAEGKPVGRDQLCALLWSNRQTAQARASLRQLLVDLRHDFGHASDVFDVATDGAISCNGTAIVSDVAEFHRLRRADDVIVGDRDDAGEARELNHHPGARLLDGLALRRRGGVG